ncbi:MAG: phenylalanine--tRNA ligase subunit beta [Candidatus Palauibacterales bacterium]|nr:phenylalanine--tRNA ligase subunit beta [Candidatus Palauibacterales bacterium]
MRISVNWLRELLPDLDADAEEIADRLSERAVPVEELVRVGEGLDDLLVARVRETRPHPNADRLTLCRVDPGDGDEVDVVCGAPVIHEGVHYPWVPPGGRLPGGMEVEAREIRGERSAGMLCSEHELGLGPDESGILALPRGVEAGQSLGEALGLPDTCLVLDLTPNRVDLAGHVGVAREVAPDGSDGPVLRSLDGPGWTPRWREGSESADAAGVTVTVESPDRCPRYLGAVIRGVEVGDSPAWLAGRLRALGARPVNNVVDATNWVLHELNQPLHAFDLGTVEGPEIRVRPAEQGEELRTLDGKERTLSPEATVIADARSPVGLAGVMGGEESEVTADTADVFLECACFDPSSTRDTARSVDLSTDASYRFERGVDPRAQEEALARCVELILATAGGEAVEDAVRIGGGPEPRREVTLRPSRVRQVLGRDVPPPKLRRLLEPLGFEEAEGSGETSAPADARLAFSVPGWRGDVEREIDLVEEVARRQGYESFPTERRAFRPSTVPSDPTWERAERVRRWLSGRGLLEARSLSLVPEERVDGERAVPLLHPLSEDEDHLRDALVPPLLDRAEHNFSRGRRSVRLYEIGTVFRRREAGADAEASERLPAEEMRAAALLTGRRRPEHWSDGDGAVDLWDVKALASEIADLWLHGEIVAGGEPPSDYPGVVPLGADRWLGPERFWLLDDGGHAVGVAGRVRPEAVETPDWAGPVFALELRLRSVQVGETPVHRELSTYPAVRWDLAFTVDEEVPVAEVEASIRDAAPGAILEGLRLFDVYRGEEIEEGRRSLAWRFTFRADDRTLEDREVEEAISDIVDDLEGRYGVRVRTS